MDYIINQILSAALETLPTAVGDLDGTDWKCSVCCNGSARCVPPTCPARTTRGAAQLLRGLGLTPYRQVGKMTPRWWQALRPWKGSLHTQYIHMNSCVQTPCWTSLRGPRCGCLPSWPDLTASQHLHFVPHRRHPPPFCASLSSQEAAPSIFCLTGGSSLHLVAPLPHKQRPLHFVPPLPQARSGRVCSQGMAAGTRGRAACRFHQPRGKQWSSLLLTPLASGVQTLNIKLLQSYSIFIPHSAPTALNWVLK